jgi:hypothetical protein
LDWRAVRPVVKAPLGEPVGIEGVICERPLVMLTARFRLTKMSKIGFL